MPLTPFHLGFAWPVWLLDRKRFHFMCLSFGSMIPDIEILAMMPFTPKFGHARGIMHSILGALTIDILAVLLIAYFVVPPVGRWLKRHSGQKWLIFAGTDITQAPSDPMWAVLSAAIGTLSHVFLDMFTHPYNPILWPYFTDRNINWMPFPDPAMSSIAVSLPLGIIVLVMALKYWSRPLEEGN